MKRISLKLLVVIMTFVLVNTSYSQIFPPKQEYPLNVRQIHSGHSLTDPLFYPHWPGQYVNLMNKLRGVWAGDDVGKSTVPGSALKARWNTAPGYGAPDARHNISNWELLTITERVPLLYPGKNSQQWYLNGIKEQREYLSLFVNNAWNNGNKGKGAPTLLWTTWTNINNSDGPWREMLDTLGTEWESMQDFANANRPKGAPLVYLIPGHKMMARLFDDINAGVVPGITNISQFFSDNIHTNELGAYAISMIHYACIFNSNPTGLTNNLIPSNAPSGTPYPSEALAKYLQTMIWDVVTNYNRTGVSEKLSIDYDESSDEKLIPTLNAFNTNEKLNIEFENNKLENLEIKIYNLSGIEVINSKYNNNEITNPISIDIIKLQTSTYVYEIIIDGRKVYTGKLIKIKE